MINFGQLREYVIRPALQRISIWSQARENLVFGTGLVESQYTYLDQTKPGPGPAYGFWQMEEATHHDLWVNYINHQPLKMRKELMVMAGTMIINIAPPITVLHGSLFYAAAMCGLHYRRVPSALPPADSASGMAAYWKQYYNTPKGAGTIARALPYFKQAVL